MPIDPGLAAIAARAEPPSRRLAGTVINVIRLGPGFDVMARIGPHADAYFDP